MNWLEGIDDSTAIMIDVAGLAFGLFPFRTVLRWLLASPAGVATVARWHQYWLTSVSTFFTTCRSPPGIGPLIDSEFGKSCLSNVKNDLPQVHRKPLTTSELPRIELTRREIESASYHHICVHRRPNQFVVSISRIIVDLERCTLRPPREVARFCCRPSPAMVMLKGKM
jgi:hypothetical protein